MAGIKRKISNEWEAGISLKKRKTDRPDHEALLSIDDLAEILDLLKRHGYSGINYYDLGLFLGLLSPTLEVIAKNHSGDVISGLRECLKAWLKEADDVKSVGGPSYYSLIQALRKLGENAVADGIDRQSTQGLD
uniref:Death domain-containing protein n=1 Tax=Amphimedon queenslandica TaxID=400682 RepID=A0A1X7SRA9_AMPQE